MLNQIHPAPFRMAGAVMDSIVILDDDDEEASTSASCSKALNCQPRTPQNKQQPQPTHITQSPFASAKKDPHVLKIENEKLFAEFVEHCTKHAVDHPEVMTYLQSRYSKALPTFLTSVEFRNTLGRCLTRAQANAGKTFVYINELCTVLKQHTVKKRTSIQPLASEVRTEDTINGGNVKQEEQGKEEEANQEEEKKTKRASRRQLAYLENLLKVYNEEIRRLQERELSVEDLEKEDSSYIQEHKLKRKMMKIYEKLCELKGCDTLTGRVIEQRIPYSGTRYPEINKKIARYINSADVLHNPPDYTDILKVVERANDRYNLLLSRKQITQIAQEAFRETGNKLQERRHLDMVYNFGSHLTDLYKPTLDPALSDQTLHRKLRSNRDTALSNLENMINKYAVKQEDVEVEEIRKKQERDKQKKQALNGQQNDSKEKESEETKEIEEQDKDEKGDEEEEDDYSSDPDIEDEIQASQAQIGQDDDEEDVEDEQLNSDNDQPITESAPPSIKSSVQDTEEDQGDGGDDDQELPVSNTSTAIMATNGKPAKQRPLTSKGNSQSEALNSTPIKTELNSSNHCTPVCTSTSYSRGITTNQDSSVGMRSASCSPLPQSPVLIDERGKYKKRKRTSSEKHTAVHNGNECTQDSSSYCDIPLDMGVISERVDLTRATTPTQGNINSPPLTPPPKKNKVNAATQCDPEEVIVLSDSD
ncbi:death domain-associated protein 6 isoform X1 [Triplophysa dalaica]|uniref:death domain-associated protein 6 isoform X1 n=2 Tax=Triplophysa dalaica TaxID=1582913 RepID=UPI0024DF5721|nr:death domain-associated protein 6 isoform X1 [Triplophysa dalaica]